jgi:diguanylate cyclase
MVGEMATPKVESKSQDIACKALERMEKESVIPTPNNYEIWYRYYDGDPEIVGAIDKINGPVDEMACQKLYKRFLSNAMQEESIRKISDQVHQALGELSALFGDVQSATTEYGETMEDAGDKIDGADSLIDLEAVVSAIVQDTKKMVEQNQILEAQLNNSSSQMDELRENLDSVRKEAMTDGLTGLSNRKAFDQYMNNYVAGCDENDKTLTLLMLDIDHFKKFNDTYGHQVGDQVLRLVSRSLTDGIKGKDFAARYGGEEFAIILPETDINAGIAVGNALRRAVESKEVVNRTTNKKLGKITMSVGVAQYRKGEVVEELIERADVALYTAKKNGRNMVVGASE